MAAAGGKVSQGVKSKAGRAVVSTTRVSWYLSEESRAGPVTARRVSPWPAATCSQEQVQGQSRQPAGQTRGQGAGNDQLSCLKEAPKAQQRRLKWNFSPPGVSQQPDGGHTGAAHQG